MLPLSPLFQIVLHGVVADDSLRRDCWPSISPKSLHRTIRCRVEFRPTSHLHPYPALRRPGPLGRWDSPIHIGLEFRQLARPGSYFSMPKSLVNGANPAVYGLWAGPPGSLSVVAQGGVQPPGTATGVRFESFSALHPALNQRQRDGSVHSEPQRGWGDDLEPKWSLGVVGQCTNLYRPDWRSCPGHSRWSGVQFDIVATDQPNWTSDILGAY